MFCFRRYDFKKLDDKPAVIVQLETNRVADIKILLKGGNDMINTDKKVFKKTDINTGIVSYKTVKITTEEETFTDAIIEEYKAKIAIAEENKLLAEKDIADFKAKIAELETDKLQAVEEV